jgi:hypothetical protein
VAWVLLLAFTLQSFVTQTHIHAAPQMAADVATAKALAGAPAHGKAPVENGTADCPLCQAIVHAGAFFAPVAPLLPLPVWIEQVAQVVAAYAAVPMPATRSWQSRAPPHH